MKRTAVALVALLVVVAAAIGIRVVLGLLLRGTPADPTPEEVALRTRAFQTHRDAIVVDAHNDVLWAIADYGFDLGMNGDEAGDRSLFLYFGFSWLPYPPRGDRVRTDLDLDRAGEGGLDAQFFPAYVECRFKETPGASRQRALELIERLEDQVRRHSERIEIAYTADDVRSIAAAGKLAAVMAIEGGHVIEDDLGTLQECHELGVRALTLTHTCSHAWADSSGDEGLHGGLTEFGREVVREMNRLGMIVDVSHVSDETFWEVLEVTRAPIIASHSNVRAIADHPRNLTDDMIRAVGDNGGVVMISFLPFHLDPEKTEVWRLASGWYWFTHPRAPETSLALLVDHIGHVVEVAGVDHVGLGSDFDNVPWALEGLGDVSDYPNITTELVRRGYSDEDVHKILGGNVLRVLEEVEGVARLDEEGRAAGIWPRRALVDRPRPSPQPRRAAARPEARGFKRLGEGGADERTRTADLLATQPIAGL